MGRGEVVVGGRRERGGKEGLTFIDTHHVCPIPPGPAIVGASALLKVSPGGLLSSHGRALFTPCRLHCVIFPLHTHTPQETHSRGSHRHCCIMTPQCGPHP